MPEKGKRYHCRVEDHTTEFIVTSTIDGDLFCICDNGKVAFEMGSNNVSRVSQSNGSENALKLGKRFRYPPRPEKKEGETDDPPDIPHFEVLIVKPGNCSLYLDGCQLTEAQPKVLPSAD